MSIRQIVLAATALLVAEAGLAQTQAEFVLAGPTTNPGSTQDLWATHYFIHQAASAPSGIPFKDKSGKVLSDNVQPRDWCLAAIEGTVRVSLQTVSKTLNYAGTGGTTQVDCAAVLKINPIKKPWITAVGKSYFAAAAGSFGDGVKGNKLVPYRTIAVDKTVLPYGTVVFVPMAQGVEIRLPDGNSIKHDGYFYAGDTGGAIKGSHIDVFCGATPTNCFPSFVTSDAAKTFKAITVKDSSIIETLVARHK